jgi:hypothetical protein
MMQLEMAGKSTGTNWKQAGKNWNRLDAGI